MSIKAILAISTLWVVSDYLAPDHDHKNYIKKYRGLAIQEMERTGIPASIKLAQAILESDAGRSTLATKARNHFGIKCGGQWNGRSYYKKDDDYLNGRLVKSCFRSYAKVHQSYIDHSEFLVNGKRYQFLFGLDPTNYKAWARGLKKAGYATSPYYHKRLIGLIERYKLYEYDTYSKKHTPRQEEELLAKAEKRFMSRNDVDYLLARDGQTVADVARRAEVSVKRLLRYNEELQSSGQQLANGEIVFIQAKRKHWRGKATWHIVKTGEDMYDIAQRYGLRLDKLYRRNLLKPGSQPAAGQRIKIRGGNADRPPKLRGPRVTPPLESLEPDRPLESTEPEEEYIWEEEEVPALPTPPVADLPPLVNPVPSPPLPNPEEQPTPVVQKFHTVRKGETLWRISQMHGISVDELKQLNRLRSNVIREGMRLRLN